MVTKTVKKGDKTVAQYLAFQLDSSKKTQREIANSIGYTNANVITMFKQGLTKIPIHVAPKLAAAIGIDPGHFLRMCMNEYMPELLPEIEAHIGGLCTKNEMAMIKAIRTVTKDADPAMDKEQEKDLVAWAKKL
jgi:hypothetical protein